LASLDRGKVKLTYRGYPRDWNIPDGEDGCEGNEEAKEAAQLPSEATGGQQEGQGQPQTQPHPCAESQLAWPQTGNFPIYWNDNKKKGIFMKFFYFPVALLRFMIII
jgi:hypothetical protein